MMKAEDVPTVMGRMFPPHVRTAETCMLRLCCDVLQLLGSSFSDFSPLIDGHLICRLRYLYTYLLS